MREKPVAAMQSAFLRSASFYFLHLTFNIKVVAMVVVGGRVGAAAHQKAALR